ncbi:MAG: hypothetical protein GVY21_03510 [Gammaproteobacteria bacterium]|jgi:signal transduction histidine kinase|nr:hypothetical protein [Gammaproteobacteria bacterium]
MSERGSTAGLARSYGYTSLFCLAIAVLLWALTDGELFLDYLVVSLCIGLSIASASALLEPVLERHLSPYLVPLPITLAGLVVGLILGGLWLGSPWYFFDEGGDTWVLGLFFGVIGFLLMGTHSRVQTLRAALAQAESERLKQEKLRLETELRLLQAQIEPHFLFNTLSNVASMIRSAPEQAEATVNDLTTLLRASLKRTRAPVATIGHELEVVRSYLEIQRIRMGERLRYAVSVADGLAETPLPPLLLQPLVENAVRHGIEPLEEGGRIDVEIRAGKPGQVQICVRDTGRGIIEEPVDGARHGEDGAAGTGIRNVLDRLEALYRGDAGLTFTANSPRGLSAVLTLPAADAYRAAG